MSWGLQLVIALAIFAGGGAAGIKYHVGVIAQRDLAAQGATAKELHRKTERIDVASVGHETDKAKIRTEFLTITEEVERVVEKPVYRDICFDDDGLRLITRAIGRGAPPGEPSPAVPGSAATD
jgi:hypothetical protein